MDVNNALSHGDLKENILMGQANGFVDKSNPEKV